MNNADEFSLENALINELSNKPSDYSTIITNYVNVLHNTIFDAKNSNYNNYKQHIIYILEKLNQYFNYIGNNYKYINIKYNINLFDNCFKIIYEFVNTLEHNPHININDIIINIKTDKQMLKMAKIFKTYLEQNKQLYNAYYDIIYISKVKKYILNLTNTHPILYIYYNIILNDISTKYINIAIDIIHKYQLYIENSESAKSNVIIELCKKNNIKNIYDIYDKIYDPEKFKCKLKFENITHINKNINVTIPKFINKDIDADILSKPTSLTNYELSNLLNKTSLPICYSDKHWLTLKNEIIINIRQWQYLSFTIRDNTNINIELLEYINKHINYFAKGYFLIYTNKLELVRNALIDINFSKSEYNTLNTLITNCDYRYVYVYCSVMPFKFSLAKYLGGGHKTALIIDKQEKKISFFEPMDYGAYQIYYNSSYTKYDFLNVILALEISKNIPSLNGYSFCIIDKIYPNQKEFFGEFETHIIHNIKSIINPQSNTNIRDWIGGYCNLWILLVMFLLSINPTLSLIDIYNFINKITSFGHSAMFCKLLIRNFAYHIENVFINTEYIIELSQINTQQFNSYDETVNTISLLNNNIPIKLSKLTNEHQRAPHISLDNAKLQINKFLSLKPTIKENVKYAQDLLIIAKKFFKYFAGNGGLALYTPDKVNFLKV